MPKTTFIFNNSPTSISGKVRFGRPDPYSIGGASPELVAAFLTAANGTTEGEYFRTGGSVDDFSMFTFSRSGTATYFDSSGVLQTAADGVARRNAYYYNGTAWTKGGLLVESEARTNLLTYSNDFTDAATWQTDSANDLITPAHANSPLGANTASKLADNGASGSGSVYIRKASVSVVTGTAYTFSGFVKADQNSEIILRYGGSFVSTAQEVLFDLNDGSYTGGGGLDAIWSEDFGGGWYRIGITATAIATASDGAYWIRMTDDAGGTTVALDGTNSVLIAGFQLEAGSIPTSYIPTSGSTVTRAAETLSVAGADTPANTTAMSISIKGLMTYADTGLALEVVPYRWVINASNNIYSIVSTLSTRTGSLRVEQDSTTDGANAIEVPVYSPGVNIPFSIAARHLASEFQFAYQGTASSVDSDPTVLVDLSSTPFEIGYTFNGFISELRIFGTDIAESGIEEVTS